MKQLFLIFVFLACALAWCPAALAQTCSPCEVTLGAQAISERKVKVVGTAMTTLDALTLPITWAVGNTTCPLSYNMTTKELSSATCDELWRAVGPDKDVTVTATPSGGGAAETLTFKFDKTESKELEVKKKGTGDEYELTSPSDALLLYKDGDGWYAMTEYFGGGDQVWSKDQAKRQKHLYKTGGTYHYAKGFSVPLADAGGGGGGPATEPELDCFLPRGQRGRVQLVCVDLSQDVNQPRYTFVPNQGTILRPNTSVRVIVLYPRGEKSTKTKLTLQMGGTRGVYTPKVSDQTTLPGAPRQQSGGCDKAEPKLARAEKLFGPRLPGEADLTVTLKEGEDETQHVVEFTVQDTYAGAVRVGVGFPFGDAHEKEYDIVTLPGSQQAEVVPKKHGQVDLELTVAYSVYLDKGGRPRVGPGACYPWCFNPFVAVGVWDPQASGINFLKSVYLGAEWEPQPNISIGIGGVARRTTELQEGVEVGSPVEGSDVPTKNGLGFGGGVIVNFSPDFLRIAKPAAGGFFQ